MTESLNFINKLTLIDGCKNFSWVLKNYLVTNFISSYSLSMTTCHQHTVFLCKLQQWTTADLSECVDISCQAHTGFPQISLNVSPSICLCCCGPAKSYSLYLSDLDGHLMSQVITLTVLSYIPPCCFYTSQHPVICTTHSISLMLTSQIAWLRIDCSFLHLLRAHGASC